MYMYDDRERHRGMQSMILYGFSRNAENLSLLTNQPLLQETQPQLGWEFTSGRYRGPGAEEVTLNLTLSLTLTPTLTLTLSCWPSGRSGRQMLFDF